jgi:RHS repeat-associated protein
LLQARALTTPRTHWRNRRRVRRRTSGRSFYNYFRDYDSYAGRYSQSDPIGLRGGTNTYTYAANVPTSGIDPLGLKVVVVGHSAAGILGTLTHPDSYHLALYLDPDDKCACQGQWPLTVGGQREDGFLVSKRNYPGDAIANTTFKQIIATPEGMTDCEFIKKILAAAASHNNKTPYSLPGLFALPGVKDGQMAPGTYNSNSYVSGVLQAAGATPPALNLPSRPWTQAPGYQNPVPIKP